MEQFRQLLLDVWREACRHIEIDQSVNAMARLLAMRLPLDCVCIVGFDFAQGVLGPRAIGSIGAGDVSLPASRTMQASERRLLQAWTQAPQVLQHDGQNAPAAQFSLLLGSSCQGSWLAAPLVSEHGVYGALLMRAHAPQVFTSVHMQMAERLIEPFSVALENDHRLHELNALREAAEADKRSALSRLGREDLVDKVIGGQGGLHAVMQRVALVARSDMPVLILGETGSGKEVIARTIHEQSSRENAPFIRVNCGAIAPELIDSELFGHEKGAFTGATTQRRGWFERADEGTLLLDEVGELPAAAQVRLLRVLQEGTFERVGGEKPIHVNVRIIAATHRDLPAMVQQGRFREDLWYRIAGFPIVLPPLRERRQDIPVLAAHFAQRAARHFGLRPCEPTAQDVMLLCDYPWPGNIRELASVIDRAAILGDGQQLAIAQALGTSNDPTSPAGRDVADVRAAAGRESDTRPQPLCTLDQAIQRHIESALNITHGRIEGPRGAARLLGINPNTLRSRMRRLKMSWEHFRTR